MTFVKANGGGASAFIDLSDAPSSYAGAGGKLVSVNVGETGLIFTPAPTPSGSAFAGAKVVNLTLAGPSGSPYVAQFTGEDFDTFGAGALWSISNPSRILVPAGYTYLRAGFTGLFTADATCVAAAAPFHHDTSGYQAMDVQYSSNIADLGGGIYAYGISINSMPFKIPDPADVTQYVDFQIVDALSATASFTPLQPFYAWIEVFD